MSQDESLQNFYNTIDSDFKDYEDSGYDPNKLSDLRNHIATEMIRTFKRKYGEKSEFYEHSLHVYMTTINDCLKAYIKIPLHERKEKFHNYFLSTLTKNINASIQLDRESLDLSVSFGKEIEKSSEARNTLRKISKLYDELQGYYEFSDEETKLNKIALLMGITIEEVKEYIPYVKSRSVSENSTNEDCRGTYSRIDKKRSQIVPAENLEIPENFTISKDNMKSILDKMLTVYKSCKADSFLRKVITFKILSCFEPKKNSESFNISSSCECVAYLPTNYDLKGLMEKYPYIDTNLLNDFFLGNFPKQKDIETSPGSVNNKWKQFNEKLLKRYRPDFEEIRDGLE